MQTESKEDDSKEPITAVPKKRVLVVFGGNGYTGQRICEYGLSSGFDVISISRRGKPDKFDNEGDWCENVKWLVGDALKPQTYEKFFFESDNVAHKDKSQNKNIIDPSSVCAVVSGIGRWNLRWQYENSAKTVEEFVTNTNSNAVSFAKKVGAKKFVHWCNCRQVEVKREGAK